MMELNRLPILTRITILASHENTQTNSKEVGDLDEREWLKSVSESSLFDFLREEHDIYHPTDGNPFNAEIAIVC